MKKYGKRIINSYILQESAQRTRLAPAWSPITGQDLTQLSIRGETGELWGTVNEQVWHWTNTNTYTSNIHLAFLTPTQTRELLGTVHNRVWHWTNVNIYSGYIQNPIYVTHHLKSEGTISQGYITHLPPSFVTCYAVLVMTTWI